MRKRFSTLLLLLALGVMTGCASETDPSSVRIGSYEHTTIDGVECIVYKAYQKGGISCNWDKYNREHP